MAYSERKFNSTVCPLSWENYYPPCQGKWFSGDTQRLHFENGNTDSTKLQK